MTATATIGSLGSKASSGRNGKADKVLKKRSATAKKKKKVFSETEGRSREEHTPLKVQFALGAVASAKIDALKVTTGASTRSEVIRKAIAIYEMFVEEGVQGVVDKDGNLVRIILS